MLITRRTKVSSTWTPRKHFVLHSETVIPLVSRNNGLVKEEAQEVSLLDDQVQARSAEGCCVYLGGS